MEHLKILKNSTLSTKEISEKLCLTDRAVQMYLSGKREIPRPTKKLIEYIFTDKEHGSKLLSTKNHEKEVKLLKEKIKELKDRLKLKDELIESYKKNAELMEGQNELLKFQLSKKKAS